MEAIVSWPGQDSAQINGFQGEIIMTQPGPQEPTTFHVRLQGFPDTSTVAPLTDKKFSLFGFHVHTNPITNLKDLKKTCAACGGHFNPMKVKHGSKLLSSKASDRHVGDLINNIYLTHKDNPTRKVEFTFTDKLARLIPTAKHPYSIIGKSIVVHEGIDDLGLEGRPKSLHEMPYYKPTKTKRLIARNINKNSTYQIEKYSESDQKKASKENGNAGARIACGNIQFRTIADKNYYDTVVNSLSKKGPKK
jgi:Cu-Zn family superoxide dismutase